MTKKSKTKTSVQLPTNGVSYRYYSQAIANALRVLELFQQSHEPLALTEVSRQVKVPKSSAFRILRTLEIEYWLRHLREQTECRISDFERTQLRPNKYPVPVGLVSES